MAFKDDEFNRINIVNEGANPNFEFGVTQDAEFTSFSDNVNNIRDEVNDNPQSNSENKTKEEQKKEKKQESSKEDSLNKANKSSGNGSGSSTASAGGTSGAIATAAGAAVVTVSVISATIGINLFISAKCKVNKMDLTPVSLNYDLDLEEVGENEHFVIKMANNSLEYNEVKELQEGSNEGYFVDLTPSTDYVVSVYNPEFVNSPIYLKTVTTPAGEAPKKEAVKVSFDSNGRSGSMTSMDVKTSGKYELPVSIFLPKEDEYFSGWKVNGEGDLYKPGDLIDLTDDTTLVAEWAKFPTKEHIVTADKDLFSYFPEQPTAEVSSVTIREVDLEFRYSTVAYSSNEETLNMYIYDGFVSTITPFAGPIKSITVNSKTTDYNLTMVYSESPIYDRATEGGETKTIEFAQDYTFECTNPDAKYFCLSLDNKSSGSASFAYMKFVYETPVIENEIQIYFDANGGEGEFGPYTISGQNYGTIPNIGTGNMDVPFVAPQGKEFAGWKIKGVGDLLKPGRNIGLSQDITLIAQWKDKGPGPKYTVTFDSNRGSSVQSQVVEEGNFVVRPDDPTRNYYMFLDWYTDEELTNPYSFEEEISSDLTLFAGWKPDITFSMFINYIDTLRESPTNKISFQYTKTDEHSLITDYYLDIDGDTSIELTAGSLDDATSNTTKTLNIDSETAAALGTGIVNYTMRATDSYGDSYEVATGSLSIPRSQMNYYLNAYIGDELLESNKTFHVMLSGTEGGSSSYNLPIRLDYGYNMGSSPEITLAYSTDGSTEKTSYFYFSGGCFSYQISSTGLQTPLFDPDTNEVTFATMRFKDSSGNQLGSMYENVTLKAYDSRYIGGFRLSNMISTTSQPSITLSACGERIAETGENFRYASLGVNIPDFEAGLTIRLLSKGGKIEKTYNIDLTSTFKESESQAMSSSVTFEFIDPVTGEDKRSEFIELAKRYVADAELTVSPGDGSSFTCLSYESYSFR